MIILMMLIAMMLLPSVVGAVQDEPNVSCTTGMDAVSVECRREAARKHVEWALGWDEPTLWNGSSQLPTTAKLFVCLDQMEAAMRAMDNYRPLMSYMRGVLSAYFVYVHGQSLEPKMQEFSLEVQEADKLFGEVKRDCWSQP